MAVHVGHSQVGNDQVVVVFVKAIECIASPERRVATEVVHGQGLRNSLANHWLVVDDKRSVDFPPHFSPNCIVDLIQQRMAFSSKFLFIARPGKNHRLLWNSSHTISALQLSALSLQSHVRFSRNGGYLKG
jgi:hypothetical protein